MVERLGRLPLLGGTRRPRRDHDPRRGRVAIDRVLEDSELAIALEFMGLRQKVIGETAPLFA